MTLDAVRPPPSPRCPRRPTTLPDAGPVRRATPRKALELTFREALRLGHNYIGTEHILLALLEIEDDDGLLTSLGLERPEIEKFIASALHGQR